MWELEGYPAKQKNISIERQILCGLMYMSSKNVSLKEVEAEGTAVFPRDRETWGEERQNMVTKWQSFRVVDWFYS